MTALSGRGRECPCCRSQWRHFAEFNGRADSLCLRCGSLERHRALAIYLREHDLPRSSDEVLHFAPEPSIGRILARGAGGYVSTDLEPGLAMVAADITALPFADGRFGLVVCSHVLEHIPDERAALAELRRVCAGGGRVLVMVPRDVSLELTDEDATVIDPAERRRRFLQEDHVRLYGRDLEARLTAAGFDVEAGDPGARRGAGAGAAARPAGRGRGLRLHSGLSAGSAEAAALLRPGGEVGRCRRRRRGSGAGRGGGSRAAARGRAVSRRRRRAPPIARSGHRERRRGRPPISRP